jgi:two-component system OmpR family response regulator
MNYAAKILIVDDDPKICALVQDFLQLHGYRVTIAYDGKQMHKVMNSAAIDLIVLDIMMPGEDGLNLCRQLREQSSVPIIMLSALGAETDRIVGLEMGADDYLPKPFSPRELLAKIRALLRRAQGTIVEKNALKNIPNLSFLDWTVDRNKRTLISPDGLTIPLSTGEYDLLLAFINHPQRTLNRDQLLDLTRGREATPYDRTIDVLVGRLRKKIEDDPKNPTIIMTVHGYGYQFTPEVGAAKHEK